MPRPGRRQSPGLSLPRCSGSVEQFDLQRPACFLSVAILINIKVEWEFSPWSREKALLSALLTSCGREGMMFHANSRQRFQSARNLQAAPTGKHDSKVHKKQNWNWMDLGCPRKTAHADCTAHAEGFEEKKKKKSEASSRHISELGVISGCSDFPANKRGDAGSLQLRKSHQLYESCEVKSN